MPNQTDLRKAEPIKADILLRTSFRWSRFNADMAIKTGGWRLYHDSLLSTLSCSIPSPHTHLDVVRQIAMQCGTPIPIELLPDKLDRYISPRGRAIFGPVGDYFDQIVRNYENMQWWISDNGLNIAPVPTIGANLSEFDELAGRLMLQARLQKTNNGRLPLEEYFKIADSLDQAGLKPLHCVEPQIHKRLAEWNQKHPNRAIHTFNVALESELSWLLQGVKKRLYRASERFSKAHPKSSEV